VILLPYITFVATLVLMRIAEVRHRARQARLAIESGHPAS